MALPTPFNPPPNTPLVQDDPKSDAIWQRWLYQLWRRIKDGALGGTVTSVGLALPTSVFDVSGSPVTTSGTLTATFDTQSANTAFMGPTTGAAATPAFRALVPADIPSSTAIIVGTTPITSGTATRLLYEGSGNLLAESSGMTFDGTTLAVTGLSNTGNTVLGDASADTYTINAGTWTIGNNFVATRAAGTVAAGALTIQQFTTTFTGDSGGTSNTTANLFAAQVQGGNAVTQARSLLYSMFHGGTNTVSTLAGSQASIGATSTGNITTARGFSGSITLSNSGNITNGALFVALPSTLSSTGQITTIQGFAANDLGSATLVTNALAFDAATMTVSKTLTASFRSQQNSGTGAWAYLATGTANSAFNGNVRIGSTTAPTVALDVTGAAKVSTTLDVTGVTTFGAPARLKGYTVGTLPAGVVGYMAYVTDLLAPTYLAAAVGGGAITGPVFYDGTNWVSI